MAKELIAMILAGGKGTRLYELTRKDAKPAVHFGGKYRIIDYALSNCAHSGIDTVGVLIAAVIGLLVLLMRFIKTWNLLIRIIPKMF